MALPLHVTEILQQSLSKIMIQSPISKMDTTGTHGSTICNLLSQNDIPERQY